MPAKKKRSPRATAPTSIQKRLVDITLRLIEQNNGCRGVNLRQIAARARCAHTNVYNYFDSLEALFWAALKEVLERQLYFTTERMKTPAGIKEPLRTFLESQIVYGQQHPAHYRLVWLESLDGRLPAEVLDRINFSRATWVRHIAAELPTEFTPADYTWAGQMIHGYFHGELCKLVSRKEFIAKAADDKERILNNTMALVKLIGLTKRL